MVDMIGDLMRRNMDAASGLSSVMLESMEHLGRLNMSLVQRQIERFSQISDVSQMRSEASPMSLFPDEIMHYPQALYEIVAHTQTRMAQILGEHFRETTREAQIGLRQGLGSAPMGMASASREAPAERARAETRRRGPA